MSLAGTTLGCYEIISLAGAGGMGEVYKARDTRLNRVVAVKVLPQQLASNTELIERFEREARAISSLQHPNICVIHDIGKDVPSGTSYLVFEYLEGETLLQRLQRGPLPLRDLLKVALEIADALEKAHRQGIAHRDLKPGNIMLTKSGAKLLDFGLAKGGPPLGMAAKSSATPSFSVADTITSPAVPLTAAGTVIGTVQYMSPEQIEGHEADARSDIFAFGAILYEMATGKRAFPGKSNLSVASAILEKDPEPISALAPTTPRSLDQLIRTCLQKNPDDRFEDVHDVKLQLRAIHAEDPPMRANVRHWRRWWPAAIGALATAMIGAVILALWPSSAHPTGIVQFQIVAPEKQVFNLRGLAGPPAVSPDGKMVVFVTTAAAQVGTRSMWLRRLHSTDAQMLSGTEGAMYPFWSPDGKYIGFFANGKLKKYEMRSGTTQSICDSPEGRGGSWAEDGTILFGQRDAGLLRVSAGGGRPASVTKLDDQRGDTSHRWPYFLPSGKKFLYIVQGNPWRLIAASFADPQGQQLLERSSNVAYEDGYLLYVKDAVLLAHAFDPQDLRFTSDPRVIAEQVQSDSQFQSAAFSAAGNGTLVYQGGAIEAGTQITTFDRAGKVVATIPEPGLVSDISLSPDGVFLMGTVANTAAGAALRDIWIYNLKRKSKQRFTFDEHSYWSDWSPDGTQIVFGRQKEGRTELVLKSSTGMGKEEVIGSLSGTGFMTGRTAWSQDGKYVIWDERESGVWATPVRGDHKPISLVPGPGAWGRGAAQVSPDSKWLAYTGIAATFREVFVVPMPISASLQAPSEEGKWQVSSGGGWWPRWNRDGKELFFTNASMTTLYRAKVVHTAGRFETEPQEALFDLPTHPVGKFYVPSPNGRYFHVVTYTQGSQAPLTVTLNWMELLQK